MDVECDGELWVTTHDLGEEACDDTSVCPVDPPVLYGTCDVDATCLHLRPSPCPEGEGYDILTYATCQGGVWMGAALAEGTACAACTGASLPTCNDEHRGVVCPLSYGEQTCVEPTGWQTGTVGTGRGLRECRDDGSWAGISDYIDCSE